MVALCRQSLFSATSDRQPMPQAIGLADREYGPLDWQAVARPTSTA
jgi:hypothetical protein